MPALNALFSGAGYLRWDGAGNSVSDFATGSSSDLAPLAAPDFTGEVSSAGDLIVGSNTAIVGMNPRVDVQAGGQNGIHVTGANLGLDFVATEYSKAACLDLRRSNGTDLSTHVALNNGDQIGKFHVGGAADSGLVDVGRIAMVATEDWSGAPGTASTGSAWQFAVTKNGTDGSTQFAAWLMDNDGSLIVADDRTYTAAPNAIIGIRSDLTLTANYASQKLPTGIAFAETRVMTTAGASGANPNIGFEWAPTYKNANGVAANLASGALGSSTNGFWEHSTVRADAATVTLGFHRSFASTPDIGGMNAGVLSNAGYYGFFSGPTVTDATVATTVGLRVNNPTLSGTGAITTAYGVDIQAFTAATTNVGIRNASTLRQTAAATFGADAAATWLMHLQGGNSATNAFGINVSTTGPTAPSSNASGVLSVYKGATNYYLLVTFNDGGTTRYKYLQLNGTVSTWATDTSLPT